MNNRRRTVDVTTLPQERERGGEGVRFEMAAMGVQLRPLPVAEGADVEEFEGEFRAHSDDEQEETVDQTLDRIWTSMPSDVMQLAPNPKNKRLPSHVLLTKEERLNVTWDMFKTLDLRKVFFAVQVRYGNREQWRKAVDLLLPPKGEVIHREGLQNYPNAVYFQSWIAMVPRLNSLAAERVRQEIYRRMEKVMWLPDAQTLRMWQTSKRPQYIMHPQGHQEACPAIIINERLRAKREERIRLSPTRWRVLEAGEE